jgi:hypothetical protein
VDSGYRPISDIRVLEIVAEKRSVAASIHEFE